MKLVLWPLMGWLYSDRGLGGAALRATLRCTKCNTLPINGQCTNHRIAVLLFIAMQFYCVRPLKG